VSANRNRSMSCVTRLRTLPNPTHDGRKAGDPSVLGANIPQRVASNRGGMLMEFGFTFSDERFVVCSGFQASYGTKQRGKHYLN
jgi:hypothetical protein